MKSLQPLIKPLAPGSDITLRAWFHAPCGLLYWGTVEGNFQAPPPCPDCPPGAPGAPVRVWAEQ